MFDRLGAIPFLYVGEKEIPAMLAEMNKGNSKYENREIFGRADIRMKEFICEEEKQEEEEEDGGGPGPFSL